MRRQGKGRDQARAAWPRIARRSAVRENAAGRRGAWAFVRTSVRAAGARRREHERGDEAEVVRAAVRVDGLERARPLRAGTHVEHDGRDEAPRRARGTERTLDSLVPFLYELRVRWRAGYGRSLCDAEE